mmetsp:Transcript_29283/g.40585  ORF Transcript_29283/g.40585 Transcript_29283/m.40585 type:complete len:89 (-) Transcript_29283:3056-3322(-)
MTRTSKKLALPKYPMRTTRNLKKWQKLRQNTLPSKSHLKRIIMIMSDDADEDDDNDDEDNTPNASRRNALRQLILHQKQMFQIILFQV